MDMLVSYQTKGGAMPQSEPEQKKQRLEWLKASIKAAEARIEYFDDNLRSKVNNQRKANAELKLKEFVEELDALRGEIRESPPKRGPGRPRKVVDSEATSA